MAKLGIKNTIPKDILDELVESDERGVIITFKVKPNAASEKLWLNQDEIILSVNAPALDNKANMRVMELLAEIFSVPKSKIEMLSGYRSRLKRVLIRAVK